MHSNGYNHITLCWLGLPCVSIMFATTRRHLRSFDVTSTEAEKTWMFICQAASGNVVRCRCRVYSCFLKFTSCFNLRVATVYTTKHLSSTVYHHHRYLGLTPLCVGTLRAILRYLVYLHSSGIRSIDLLSCQWLGGAEEASVFDVPLGLKARQHALYYHGRQGKLIVCPLDVSLLWK